MSTTDTTEQQALMCPGCGEPLGAAQTICDACRSALEEQVLTVKAADYPALFHNVVRNSGEQHRSPVDPTSMDMLKVAENTSDDLDLVPLVPIDEPRRTSGNGSDSTIELASAAPAPARSGSSATETEVPLAPSPTPAAPSAPSPVSRPSYTVYSPPPAAPKLEPSSRWKHVVIAVLGLAAAAGLAAVLWSTLVPGQPAQSDDTPSAQPAAAKRAAK